MRVRNALISVWDKRDLEEFARGLTELGVQIFSSGGTARFLRERRIPVKEVSELTGFPEILDGRVKTLHPIIHAGILARRDLPSHLNTLREKGIPAIDLVAVNLYPFVETISKAGVTLEEALENIDIGGPAMVRAAAKNYRDVIVVVRPERYGEVLRELREKGDLSEEKRLELAVEAFAHTSSYDSSVQAYLAGLTHDKGLPPFLGLSYRKVSDLRYGQNPHQRGALYTETPAWGIASARLHQGKELSFNNLMDLDAALDLLREFEETTAVVIKHTNPCGLASDPEVRRAYVKARECDPISAFGGVVGINRRVDRGTAEEITSTFIEAVVAPSYEPEALEVMKKKTNMRVLELPSFESRARLRFRQISGGLLVEDENSLLLRPQELRVVTERKPTPEEMEQLLFAWKVVKHVKSNAIVVARDKQAVGVGAGQTSRVDSTEIALKKAGPRARGAVLASDAFFPFPDSVQKAAEAGITAIIQPGGSIRDQESVNEANRHGMAMVFTGVRHFKH
ncbi:MAG: bifunctional phosphoribosylaminoimidazolecarboxamide formyltransferase/IMP cyclohydrolase [Candidatus Hadarchaeales archaeon]